jgi:hypothetical protein
VSVEAGRIGEEIILTYFNRLSKRFPEGTEENKEIRTAGPRLLFQVVSSPWIFSTKNYLRFFVSLHEFMSTFSI